MPRRKRIKIKNLWDLAYFHSYILERAWEKSVPIDEAKQISAMCAQVAKTYDTAQGPQERTVNLNATVDAKVEQNVNLTIDAQRLQEAEQRINEVLTSGQVLELPQTGT